MKKGKRYYADISNFYGGIYVYKKRFFKYFLGIEDYDGDKETEISWRLYRAFVNEFKHWQDDDKDEDNNN